MLSISLYNVSAQKRRLTQIFADYYSNYLFLEAVLNLSCDDLG